MGACSLDDAGLGDWPFTPGPEWYRELDDQDLPQAVTL